MKTATIRHLQHHLSEVIQWVELGEEVQVTRHRRPVARMVPARPTPAKVKWPDFLARAGRIKIKGKTLSQTITEDREERL